MTPEKMTESEMHLEAAPCMQKDGGREGGWLGVTLVGRRKSESAEGRGDAFTGPVVVAQRCLLAVKVHASPDKNNLFTMAILKGR